MMAVMVMIIIFGSILCGFFLGSVLTVYMAINFEGVTFGHAIKMQVELYKELIISLGKY